MTWKNLILVPFLALTPVIVGCGADCEDICEKSNEECDGTDNPDCSKTCTEAEELAEKAGCEDQFDEVLSCADDADDICSENGCESESEAYGKCIVSYCTSHQTDSVCTGLTG